MFFFGVLDCGQRSNCQWTLQITLHTRTPSAGSPFDPSAKMIGIYCVAMHSLILHAILSASPRAVKIETSFLRYSDGLLIRFHPIDFDCSKPVLHSKNCPLIMTFPPPPPPPPAAPAGNRAQTATTTPQPPAVTAIGPPGTFKIELLIFNGYSYKDHWAYWVGSHSNPDIGVLIHAVGDVEKGLQFSDQTQP